MLKFRRSGCDSAGFGECWLSVQSKPNAKSSNYLTLYYYLCIPDYYYY